MTANTWSYHVKTGCRHWFDNIFAIPCPQRPVSFVLEVERKRKDVFYEQHKETGRQGAGEIQCLESNLFVCYTKMNSAYAEMKSENDDANRGSLLWLLVIKSFGRCLLIKDLCSAAHISHASMAKLGKSDNVTTYVLVKICNSLQCGICDIMEIVNDSEGDQK